ncbi:NAF1-domain-containing protein [Choiromyces venosus 120613-1]|uniref:H/ACA ribonucleoprotein complex non-core subunit NAF1 n=1 Tax=Choiromyces venosus 120613-1 TaxID=1336337 RepID=A0A3N4J867_9PEZI|nr:NAF1-domain-containing protein [Choiromyces venosus 120613-1]
MLTELAESANNDNDETDPNKAESVNSYDSIDYSPCLPDPPPSTITNDNTVKPTVPVGSETDITMGGTEDRGLESPQKKIKEEELSSELYVNFTPPADATNQTKTPTMREKKPIDPYFLKEAQENKGNPDPEWQFSSDDQASDEEELSTDEEDSDDEGRYSPMNAAEMAQLLMREDGGYDNSSAVCTPLRTKNEIAEEEAEPERPDIVLTPDMTINPVGFVKSIVGKLALIEASDPGHQRVLGEGSVLAFEDRTVLGVVNEVLGRVEMPLYTVRFRSLEEIEELGVTVERKVFSVVQHTEFVFTQPLKAIKGSDASNLYDEEIPITEQEFSDDEAEAEHKKSLKEARQEKRGDHGGGTRGNGSRGGRGGGRGWGSKGPAPTQIDEPYIPLSRPTNLQEMYTSEPPPPPPPNTHGQHRGSNRKRGDKGRGRGSHRGKDSFAGRGGGRGSQSQNDRDRPRLSPPVPTFSQNNQSSQPSPSLQQPYPYSFPSQWPAPEQQAEFIRLLQGQAGQWPGIPQFPMAPSFPLPPPPQHQQFQQQRPAYQAQQQPVYQNQQQGPYFAGQPNPQQQHHQLQNLPTGAHINPAFWGVQGQAQTPQSQTNYSPPAPPQQMPVPADETATARTVRESLEILKNLSK